VRRYGHFAESEEAVQEALVAAARQWPSEGRPSDPRAWLITVASRRLVDQLRSDEARRRREEADLALTPADRFVAPAADAEDGGDEDDTVALLALCCHPDLAPPSQVALALRAVGGLTTAEIATAYLVPEPTMAQRISRAKRTIDRAGRTFGDPELGEASRAAVLHVLYLIFNEGYVASAGAALVRVDLVAEAIRLGRAVRRRLAGDGEADGLLALMLLTDARRAARTTPDGELVALPDQDRNLWNAEQIAEGIALVEHALSRHRLGPYQLQAAIAALHAEAATAADTDWPQILALYELLVRTTDNPAFELHRAVAVGMVRGPREGLAALDALRERHGLPGHRAAAVRAHLLEEAGEDAEAVAEYRRAASLAHNAAERSYLLARAERLRG
jgi:RNA polymerase sigma factor (sigma-70 family)